jgi:hyperosmotically inducible protein
MKFLKSFLILSIAIIGFSYTNVQAQSFSDTQRIEQKVFKKIIGLPYYGVFDNIKFQVDGSTVILSGKVYSLGVKNSAENVVKKIDGVENVINNIEMLPPSSFDNSIRRNIVRSFARDGGNLYSYLREPNPSIRIIVDNGRVALEGYVSSKGDYNLANILANGIPGVFNVENNLIVGKEPR